MRRLYGRDHLDHVLGTFGLILFFDELVRLIWGPEGLSLPLPSWLNTSVQILPGVQYSAYRLSIIVVSLAVAGFLYVLVMRTRIGMLIRAGASNREMVGALGVNIKLLYTLVFGLGAALAGLAGLMQAPILTVQIGMGENILIVAFVITVIGGIGSIRGAFIAALLVGFVDTLGRAFFPDLLRLVLSPERGVDRGAGALLHADLPGDGDRPGGAAGRAVPGGPKMSGALTVRNIVVAALLAALALLPVYVALGGNVFFLTLFTRIVILGLAAVSLNLILGYGGMMSFGHAAYLGIGGYAVGILAHEGIYSGFVQWPVALLASALFALVIGALSLRTRGVYFIMITLAFAQMAYYVVAGLARYGGDDGLTIYKRSQFFAPLDLTNKVQFYYVCLALLFASIYLVHRLVNSRFGMVVQGSRSNDLRMRAIGFPTYRYRLVCFVIAGTLCGLAGALIANNTDFVSPSMMYWTRSGDLIIMVVLGGMGSVIGPLIGAVALLVLEEFLSGITEYWQIILGPLLLLVVLFARGGIDGLLSKIRAKAAHERALAAGRASGQALRGRRRHRRSDACGRGRRAARHHRTERRRQDHADLPARRPVGARFRPHPLRRPGHHRAADVCAQPARPRPLVPDHVAVSRSQRAR